MLDGPERLARLLAEEARPAKLRGLATFREYEEALTSYYLQEDPLALGVSTGWPSLDKYYRVAPGELTIVTGEGEGERERGEWGADTGRTWKNRANWVLKSYPHRHPTPIPLDPGTAHMPPHHHHHRPLPGIPNSGKSEFLDALLVNLAENHGWAFAMCSLEKGPVPHLKALIEKRMRKPFKT